MKNKKASIFGGEQVLFLRLKKHKDKQAFIEAYDLYIEQIHRFVYFKLGDKEEAEARTERAASPLDRRGRPLRKALGVRASREIGRSGGQT